MHLEHDLAVGRHRDAISVGQRQLLGVVEHRVEVLDPDGVDRAIQHQPHVVAYSTTPAGYHSQRPLRKREGHVRHRCETAALALTSSVLTSFLFLLSTVYRCSSVSIVMDSDAAKNVQKNQKTLLFRM